MNESNNVLEILMKKYNFYEYFQLSKKDLGEVYSIKVDDCIMILKIQRDLVNYNREIGALKLLNEKNFQAPRLLEYGTINEVGLVGYFIQEFWNGDTLNKKFSYFDLNKKQDLVIELGSLLGKMSILFEEEELEASGLWKYAYEGIDTYRNYNWFNLYKEEYKNWINLIHVKGKEEEFFIKESIHVIEESLHYADKPENIGLIHRDFGLRNVMINDGCLRGIIDFEYAVLGDILFDLSKIIFNDLNFWKDKNLIENFFYGWNKVTKTDIDWSRLWLYLAIQGLGAIQWVDRQKDYRVQINNKDYREKGQAILKEACTHLKKGDFGICYRYSKKEKLLN